MRETVRAIWQDVSGVDQEANLAQMFKTIGEFKAALSGLPDANTDARVAALARNKELTKPDGSLGHLEELAIWYAGWRAVERPEINKIQIAIFAGNHGIAARGVSAYPAEVTAQMVSNFDTGGAAINQIAELVGADLTILALDLDHPTADFTEKEAMSEADLCAALSAGWHTVDPDAELFVAGEMGIGNTTIAAALCAALFGGDGTSWAGRGTGIDEEGLWRKAHVVDAGLARHRAVVEQGDALAILRALGGREVAAMTGAYARARALGIPVILDGFIACSAAAVLAKLVKGGLDNAIAGHASAEAGHDQLLGYIGKKPLLRLGLRLGEGSGAAIAIPILQSAILTHSGMASFSEAGVADKD